MVRPCALPHVITPARIPLQAEKRRGWATGNDVEYRDEGPMGAGWSWNLDERVIQGDCNLWTVVTGSGSQTFRRLETNGPFEAEKGYHAKLALVSDELVFTDLSNTKHFFRHAGHDGEWRLDRVVEPHGDRLVPTYDGHGLLVEMAEMAAEDLTRPVRRLLFNYQFIAGSYRLTSVVSGGSPAQDVEVRVVYGYDERYGNLIAVRREDVHDAELPIEERYTYTGDARPDDPHQLVRVEDANAAETGGKTEYEYYALTDTFPGEVPNAIVGAKDEYVKRVLEYPGGDAPAAATAFAYDFTEVPQQKWKTTVTDPVQNRTLYVLNGNGSTVRVEEPPGTFKAGMVWAPDDILKMQETDANGRVTDYDYDANGNPKTETIHTADFGDVVMSSVHDLTFNKLTSKTDALQRTTQYVLDPATGDVTHVIDAENNDTEYHYDAHGRLEWVKSPRGHTTTYSNYDTFGYGLPERIVLPEGVAQTRVHDFRGRVVEESDTQGHQALSSYDAFDRVRVKTRRAGQGSDDERTAYEYFPGGQQRSVTNARGLRTTFQLDGLNRVIGTRTVREDGPDITTETHYLGTGTKETERDARGVWRHFYYDEHNRLRRVEIDGPADPGPVGTVATFEYDPVGNKTRETDVTGAATEYHYDGLYRVKEKVLPESGSAGPYTEHSTYDTVGNLRSVTDAGGNMTEFDYDNLNRLVWTRNAKGQVSTVTYLDPEGSKVNKAEEHDQVRGLRTTYLYDRQDREVQRQVHLEGEDGDPSPGPVYTTETAYRDGEHAVVVTRQPGQVTRTAFTGLDQPYEQVSDPDGLALLTRTVYDGLGKPRRVTDPCGNETRLTHDQLGRLTATHDVGTGHEAQVRYDDGGLKTSDVDRDGVTKTYTYDTLGRPLSTTLVQRLQESGGPWHHATRYFDTAFRREEEDARGNVTVFALDHLGRVVRRTDPDGKWAETGWDGVNKRFETDRRGARTLFDYDPLNRLQKVTDPAPFAAQTVETVYDDAGNRTDVKDRNGVHTVTQTDPLGRVVSVTRGGKRLELHAYDPFGNRVQGTDGEGKVTRFGYDAANRLVSRTDGFGSPLAGTTRYLYADGCNQTDEVDPRAQEAGDPFSVHRVYDSLHRVKEMTDGQGRTTHYGYDGEGHKTYVREPQGQETTFTYEELGQLRKVTQPPVGTPPVSPVTTYAYDENRNRTRQTDGRNKVVSMHYDALNRLDTFTQDPDGPDPLVTRSHYDDGINLTQVDDPSGQTVTSVFNALNRLTSRVFTPAAGAMLPWRHTTRIDYTDYDPNGNLREIQEQVASGTDPPLTLTTSRIYDDWNRLLSETTQLPDGGSRTVAYTYFDNGTRKTVSDPESGLTSYTYDARNRLATATTAGGVTNYEYWPDDLLKTVSTPNGVVASYGYDKADELTSLTNVKGGTTLSAYAYTYWDNGNRKTQTETNGGVTELTAYTYDALNRLETITYPADATYPQGRVVRYGYDAVGNRTHETTRTPGGALLGEKAGTFDTFNRLTTLSDLVDPAQSMIFGYDRNGNQTSKQVGAGVPTLFSYDVRDRLVEVGQDTNVLGRFQYDFEGRRTKKIGEEGVRQYVYDQTSLLAEYDGAGARKAKYDYGSDRLISLTRTDEGRRYYSFDALRTVVNLTDDAGAAVASYHVDAWGNFRFPSELLASKNRFAFTGYFWDQETNLFFAKARFYDPEVGRFTSQDSYLGQIDEPPSLHRYFYANANPVRYVDRDGHVAQWIVGAGVGAAIGFGFNAVRQGVAIYEGAQDHWEWGQFFWAGGSGAVLGAVAVTNPVAAAKLGMAMSLWGAHEGGREIAEGHPLTGSLDIGASMLGAWASARVSPSGAVAVGEGRTGPMVRPVADVPSGMSQGPFEVPQTTTTTTLPQGLRPSAGSSTLPNGVTLFGPEGEGGAAVITTLGQVRVSVSLEPQANGAPTVRFTLQEAIQSGRLAAEGSAPPGIPAETPNATTLPGGPAPSSVSAARSGYSLDASGRRVYEIPAGATGGPTAGRRISPQLREDLLPSGEPAPACSYCRFEDANPVDHVKPRVKGGNLEPDNTTPACPHCNSSKSDRVAPKTAPSGYPGEWPPGHWPQNMIDWWRKTYGGG